MGFVMTPQKQGERSAESSNREFELAPAGNHVAVCYLLVGLGTQYHAKEGDPAKQWYPEVYISFELSDEAMSDGRPFAVGKKYRMSLYETAILAKDLKNWFPDKFKLGVPFDLSSILGEPCQVTVSHSEPRDGKVYANVDSVAPLNKRMAQPTQVNPNVCYSIDDGSPGDNVPEFLRKKVATCLEFAGQSAALNASAYTGLVREAKPPTSGRALFAWAKGIEDSKRATGVVAFLNEFGKANGLADRMIDWDVEDVEAGHEAAMSEFFAPGRQQAAPTQQRQPAPTTTRRPASTDGVPRDGRSLFAWMKDMEVRHEVGLLKYMSGWGKLQELPARIIDWDGDQVAMAHQEAVRKLAAIKPATTADVPPSQAVPDRTTETPREAGSDDGDGMGHDPDSGNDDIPY